MAEEKIAAYKIIEDGPDWMWIGVNKSVNGGENVRRLVAQLLRGERGNKSFLYDVIWNMLAFMIYIFSQQIILYPVMAKLLDSDGYASLILCVTIMNVFCNVLGGQLGVTHQLQKNAYVDSDDECSDFTLLMIVASVIIIFFFLPILVYLNVGGATCVGVILTALMSNYRMYIRYYFRMGSSYRKLVTQNTVYLIGIVIGVMIYPLLKNMWLPLFIGETMSLCYTFLAVPMKRIRVRKTESLILTTKRYIGLGSADLLTNMTTMFDKLLIYPLMGADSLAVYNSGTATSKVASLVANPLNEVILVELSRAKNRGKSGFLKKVICVSLVASAAVFIVLIPTIYLLSYILYRQYLKEICSIILLLSMSCSVGFTSSVLKSFLVKYVKTSKITFCYFINLCVLVLGGMIGAKYGGLRGYAGAVALAGVELLMSFVLVLYKYVRGENYEGST